MHDTDKAAVTQEQADAHTDKMLARQMVAWCNAMNGREAEGMIAAGIRKRRLTSVEAATREKDAQIRRLAEAWNTQNDLVNNLRKDILLYQGDAEKLRLMEAERNQLQAKLDEAEQIIMAVVDFEEDHTDPACQGKHPFIARARAFLASAPQPEPAQDDDWGCDYCRSDGRLNEMGCCPRCDAQYPDDPEQKTQGAGAEPVAWQYRYRPAGTKAWSDWGDGKAPDMRGGSYETEERPLYAPEPASKEGCASCHEVGCGGECLG